MKFINYRFTCVFFILTLFLGNYTIANASPSETTLVTTYIDDQSSSWKYIGGWYSIKAVRAYNGKTHISNKIGDSASVNILGTRFSLLYTKAANKGELNVFVDNVLIGKINENFSGTAYKSLWNSPILSAGYHQVKIIHTKGKNIDIDAIKISRNVAVYYVDEKNGSDLNIGTQTSPWETIQKAANIMAAGDSVIVLPGTYPERVNVIIPGQKFSAQGIVNMLGFTVLANNTTVSGFYISTNTSSHPDGMGIYVTANSCVLLNNNIHDTVRDGILIKMPSMGCIVKDNIIARASQSGIEVQGQNNLIEGNNISDTIQYPPLWNNPPSWVDADGIRFFGSGNIIRKNYIHGILPDGPGNINPHIDCFQTWNDSSRGGVTHDITITQNKCDMHEAAVGSGYSGKGFQVEGGTYNLKITNNIIIANLIGIIKDSHDISFLNNTFVGNPALYSEGFKAQNMVRLTIKNNIFSAQRNGTGAINVDEITKSTISSGYNCIYISGGSRPKDIGEIRLNPLLTSTYSLALNSPCINKGFDVGIKLDYAGHVRKQGTGFDIGAFEVR